MSSEWWERLKFILLVVALLLLLWLGCNYGSGCGQIIGV